MTRASGRIPLAVFARAPMPGHTKTRLIPVLGAERAAALHRAFIEDTLRHGLEADTFDVTLWCAGDPDDPALAELCTRHRVTRRPQPPGELGARMAHALGVGLEERGRALVIGTDAPTLPARLLRRAASALEGSDGVVGPAADGGYYLIGARRAVPPIFDGVPWSTSRVLQRTCRKAAAAGLDLRRLSPWYDVDTGSDLALLRAHLRLDPAAAPVTAAALGLAGRAEGRGRWSARRARF